MFIKYSIYWIIKQIPYNIFLYTFTSYIVMVLLFPSSCQYVIDKKPSNLHLKTTIPIKFTRVKLFITSLQILNWNPSKLSVFYMVNQLIDCFHGIWDWWVQTADLLWKSWESLLTTLLAKLWPRLRLSFMFWFLQTYMYATFCQLNSYTGSCINQVLIKMLHISPFFKTLTHPNLIQT